MINLSDEQKKILNLEKGTHLVLAPPGSGKTELLSQRVISAIKSGANPAEMICLTFTNRAAQSMKERIQSNQIDLDILTCNIHYYCLFFLKKNNLISNSTSILDEEDSLQLIIEILSYYKSTWSTQPILETSFNLKLKSLDFELFDKRQLEYTDREIIKIANVYNRTKDKYNLIDFNDILYLALHHLSNNKRYEYDNFRWLQIDEVQDLNAVQWAIIKLLSSRDSLSVYFGDLDQAIFSFMGAKLDLLIELKTQCERDERSAVHYLSVNYRSPSYITEINNKYLETHLKFDWPIKPTSVRMVACDPGDLTIHNIKGTIENELYYISERLIPEFTNNPKETTAVLVRYNKTADTISEILSDEAVDHFKVSGYDLFRRKYIKGLLAFLSVLVNSNSLIDWARIFYEFRIITQLNESRKYTKLIFDHGINPLDFILYNGKSTTLIEFNKSVYEGRIVVFDTETTGLDTEADDIIQIAAIEIINGKIGRTFEVYINTDKDLGESEDIHNISRKHLDKYGVPHKEGLNQFLNFLGDKCNLVAHNLKYDINILKSNLKKYANTDISNRLESTFDTIDIAKRIFPELPNYKLEFLIDHLNLSGVNSHNALDDVKATCELILALAERSLGTLEEQRKYLDEVYHQNRINIFTDVFGAFYQKIMSLATTDNKLADVVRMYFEYTDKIGITFTDNFKNTDGQEIMKLLNHIKYTSSLKTYKYLENEFVDLIPFYKTCKEQDLYIGDQNIFISTVHKAKGLEFDNVIIATAIDEIYPGWNAEGKDVINESARLFYVALTRAKKRIHISHHDTFITRSGREFPRTPSRFLEGIDHFFTLMNW